MRLTRNDMARVIVQALYNLPELPAFDHSRVVKLARCTVASLNEKYRTAHKILTDKAEGAQ